MLSLPDFREKQIIICFSSQGQKTSFKNDNLIVRDAEEKIILQVSCHRIFTLWIVGPALITSGLLERSKRFGFSIGLFSYTFRLYGQWRCLTEGNFLLRGIQYNYKSVDVASHLVYNKIHNQAALLRGIRKKNLMIKDAIEKLDIYAFEVRLQDELTSILGIEGAAARIFFSAYFMEIGWNGRRPRVKADPMNTLMDIGYTMLFNFIEALLNLYGFDLYVGVYHRNFYQRKSLVCDLVEPFRCIIDKAILRAAHLGMFKSEDFSETKGQYFLRIEKNKDYTRWLMTALLDQKEHIFLYVQLYYRAVIQQRAAENYPVFKI